MLANSRIFWRVSFQKDSLTMAFVWKPVSCPVDLYLYRTAFDMAEKFPPEKNHSTEGTSAFYYLVFII